MSLPLGFQEGGTSTRGCCLFLFEGTADAVGMVGHQHWPMLAQRRGPAGPADAGLTFFSRQLPPALVLALIYQVLGFVNEEKNVVK